jgi:hypothetical protein
MVTDRMTDQRKIGILRNRVRRSDLVWNRPCLEPPHNWTVAPLNPCRRSSRHSSKRQGRSREMGRLSTDHAFAGIQNNSTNTHRYDPDPILCICTCHLFHILFCQFGWNPVSLRKKDYMCQIHRRPDHDRRVSILARPPGKTTIPSSLVFVVVGVVAAAVAVPGPSTAGGSRTGRRGRRRRRSASSSARTWAARR